MIDKFITKFMKEAYKLDKDTQYEILQVNPISLVNKNRIDIMAKLIYLEMKEVCNEYATDLYLEHIRVMTKDSFVEAGSDKKDKSSFITSFEYLLKNMKENGFEKESLPIPVDKNFQLMDGAHRTAAAIFLNIPVTIIKIDVIAKYDQYDFTYFMNHMMKEEYLDHMILRYIKLKNKKIACLNIWPSAIGHDEEVNSLIENVLYKKNVKLNENGAFNYLAQIYKEYSWAKNDGDGFSGIYRKLVPCFPNFNPVKVFFIEIEEFKEILDLKEKIRKIYKIDKHSVHATDNIEETIQMSEILLSKNSIDFLNNANVIKYKNTFKLLDGCLNFDLSKTVFTGSIVLALYGIREANDLDYLSIIDDSLSHNEYIKLYGITLNEAIFDPRNYFIYFGRKFLTLSIIKQFKINRNENKDKEDVKMIDMILSNQKDNLTIKLLRAKRRCIAKIQGIVLKLAHNTGTYDILRTIYKLVKQK